MEHPLTIRCRTYLNSKEEVIKSLESQGVHVAPAPYLPYAYSISEFNHILALDAYIKGKIVVQDVSSMLVAEVADPKKGDYVIDVCAAPGGKSLHMGDKMEGYGTVDARDVSQYKVNLIEENIQRTNSINVQARVQDATIFDQDSELLADVVIADVPCSGYGVIGKKPEIKEENEENMMWFLNNYPFKLESLDPYLPEELHSETTALGYLQLLPGVHKTDGFFIAKFRRK